MFNILKRILGAKRREPSPARKRPSAASGAKPSLAPLGPLPVPEVQEVNDESAWDMWEQSQFELDSRMGPLSVFDSVKAKDASPSQVSDLDPFASIRRRE